MVTDNERREVAQRLRELDYAHFQESLICAYLDALGIEGYEDWAGVAHRLADLIDPPNGFDLDTVQRVCFECMKGCDEPEYTLYTTIYDAIARYKRGESGPTGEIYALLSLADEMGQMGNNVPAVIANGDLNAFYFRMFASRIRKILGVFDDGQE